MGKELNTPGLVYARTLIRAGTVDRERGDWSEGNPTADEENAFLEKEGWTAYSHWHLGVDHDGDSETKSAWSFPFGDFHRVYRSGVIACEARAAQQDYDDIRDAARSLLDLIDADA